jgi:hypothetical protein
LCTRAEAIVASDRHDGLLATPAANRLLVNALLVEQ